MHRAEAGARPLGRSHADDHEVLFVIGPHLDPVLVASFAIGRRGPLADDALDPEPTHLAEEILAALLDVVGVAQRSGRRKGHP